jgi:hypothetical protein
LKDGGRDTERIVEAGWRKLTYVPLFSHCVITQ